MIVRFALVNLLLLSIINLSAVSAEVDLNPGADDAKLAELNGGQLTKFVELKAVDPDGSPIPGVKVTPWALRSSQGHGSWKDVNDDPAGLPPKVTKTDEDGLAKIAYPFYRSAKEKTRTFEVTVRCSHPDFSGEKSIFIDVPATTDEPTIAKMHPIASLAMKISVEGDSVSNLDLIYPSVSAYLDWREKPATRKVDDQLVMTALRHGTCNLILARIEDGAATHFSSLASCELAAGEQTDIKVDLKPAATLRGRLSEDVPRPIKQGRLTMLSVPDDSVEDSVTWMDWVPINDDGTFTIQSWPADLPVQITGLAEGYVLASGDPPEDYQRSYDASRDPFQRPQIVMPENFGDEIVLTMEPMVPVTARVVDLDDKPVADVEVASWPNVGWWNWGSQIYGEMFARSRESLTVEDLEAYFLDRRTNPPPYQSPFSAVTDQEGTATLEIPDGREYISVISDDYNLPVLLGNRDQRIVVEQGKPFDLTLRVVPAGTDLLGDYDKLAGVVFGCSTREGKRICALPEVRAKMDEFTKRLREASDPRDPAVLAEAYLVVADAFDKAGDPAEAAKWRAKSQAEEAKL